jgi:hypothetical protein
MKFCLPLLSALLIASARATEAQSSPSPDNASTQAAAAQNSTALPAPSPSATAPVEPPSLIPPNVLPAPGELPKIPTIPDLEQLNNFFRQTSLGKAADEHRLHLQMAALESRIRNDEDLHAAKAAADRAPTDLEKRHRLRAYYELYYGKLIALADSDDLKKYLDAQKAAHELTLLQPRVRPESDEAEAKRLAAAKAEASVAPAPTPIQVKANQKINP